MGHRYIINKLKEHGHVAYMVGGAVRDTILNLKIKDVDIATSASLDQIVTIFGNEAKKLQGASFQVVLVNGYEVASFRKDEYFGLSSKNVKVTSAKTIEEDLSRRDFTINSMAYDEKEKKLIDPYNGKKDLENHIIRFTQAAKDRIFEDPDRIIRACRFLAKLEAKFDQTTYKELATYSYLIAKYVSPERIHKEILLVLKYKHAGMFFSSMNNIEALQHVLPSLANLVGMEGGKHHKEDIFIHSLIVGEAISKNKPLLRLAGFLHDVGKKPACKKEKRTITFIDHEYYGYDLVRKDLLQLKFSNQEIKYVTNLVKHHMRSLNINSSPKSVRKLLYDLKKDDVYYMDWLRLKIADRAANLSKHRYTRKEIKAMILKLEKELIDTKTSVFSLKDLAINGNDIMTTLNISPGKDVGLVLKYCFTLVTNDPSVNTKEYLLNKALEFYNSNKIYSREEFFRMTQQSTQK
jgi:tRNA nucleotidyltransferase/poly(A) polymerase